MSFFSLVSGECLHSFQFILESVTDATGLGYRPTMDRCKYVYQFGNTFPFRFSIIRIFLVILCRDKMPPPKDPIKYEEYRRKISEAAKLRAPPSNETRRKMSESHKNLSEETRRKISEAGKKRYEDPNEHLKHSALMKGEKNPNYGKKMSDEQRQKLNEAGRRRAPVSEETGRKTSESLKKHYEDPIKGEETRKKISEAEKGEKNPNYGKKMSDEQRQKLSKAQTGKHYSIETRMKHSACSCRAKTFRRNPQKNE